MMEAKKNGGLECPSLRMVVRRTQMSRDNINTDDCSDNICFNCRHLNLILSFAFELV